MRARRDLDKNSFESKDRISALGIFCSVEIRTAYVIIWL